MSGDVLAMKKSKPSPGILGIFKGKDGKNNIRLKISGVI